MKKFIAPAFVSIFLCLSSSAVQADNFTDLIRSAEKNYKAQNYSKALEDLEWARKEISNQHLKSMKSFFPAEIDGMVGKDVDGASVMGIQGITKIYTSSDQTRSVSISLVSGGASPAGGGLGSLMNMASSLGMMVSDGNSKVIIEKGYKGQFVMEDRASGTLTFNLNGGKIIAIETEGYNSPAMAEKVAKMLDLAKIEATL